MEPIWAVGLMTGTVLDGNIDVALLKTDGERIESSAPTRWRPIRNRSAACSRRRWRRRGSGTSTGRSRRSSREAEEALTRAQSAAVQGISSRATGMTHGRHRRRRLPRPDRCCIARRNRAGIGAHPPARRRRADARSCWAPRSPTTSALPTCAPAGRARRWRRSTTRRCCARSGREGDTAVLNLGGVANVTWWDGEDDVVAFDTGPANAPINDFIKAHGLGDDGPRRRARARRHGRRGAARRLLEHPYLTAPYPNRSTASTSPPTMAEGLIAADGAATLTAFTAAAVGKALDLLPHRPKSSSSAAAAGITRRSWRCSKRAPASRPCRPRRVGWRGDAIEAECFAFLAVRVLRGLPISFPTTTGVPQPMTGGRLAG